ILLGYVIFEAAFESAFFNGAAGIRRLSRVPLLLIALLLYFFAVEDDLEHLRNLGVHTAATAGILAAYLVLERKFGGKFMQDGSVLLVKIIEHIRRYRLAVFNALALSVFIYCYLYSAGFRYAKGILNGL